MTDWTGHQMWTEKQFRHLVAEINPRRVRLRDGNSYLAQHDVRAHLTRIFGFGMWEKTVQELTLVSQERATGETRGGKPKTGWDVVYRCVLRLTVYSPDDPLRVKSWSTEDVAIGQGSNQPSLDLAHDLAAKTAVSYALKRCAIDLGDQFGLGLYNGGQVAAFVGGSHIRPPDEFQGQVNTTTGELQGVEIVSDGHDDEGSQETPPEYDNPGTADTSKMTRHRPEAPEVPCQGSCASSYPPGQLRDGLCKPCWYAARDMAVPEAQGAAQTPPAPAPAPAPAPVPVVEGVAVKVESPTSLGVRWNKVKDAEDFGEAFVIRCHPTTAGQIHVEAMALHSNAVLVQGLTPGEAYAVTVTPDQPAETFQEASREQAVHITMPLESDTKASWPKVAKVKP